MNNPKSIRNAHDAGEYAKAIRIHETPITANLMRTYKYRLNAETSIALGNSYAKAGNHEEAQTQYLNAIGWSRTQYEGYCMLSDTCDKQDTLAKLAEHTANAKR